MVITSDRTRETAHTVAFPPSRSRPPAQKLASPRRSAPPTALTGLQELRKRLDAPRALSDYGFTADGVAEAAAVVQPTVPASNRRPVTTESLTRLLEAALSGEEPRGLLEH